MAKNESLQKENLRNTLLRVGIKTAIGLGIIVFIYVFYEKIDFSANSFSPKSSGKTSSAAPSELKWFNDFKGVENVPVQNSKQKEKSSSGGNFLQYEAAKNK